MLNRVFSVMLAGSLILVAAMLGSMAVDRKTPVDIISFYVENFDVRPGDDLRVQFRYVQHRKCSIYVERAVYGPDNVRHQLAPTQYQNLLGRTGVQQDVSIDIAVPPDMPLGRARYERTAVFRCNPLHHLWPIIVSYPPVFFEVVQ